MRSSERDREATLKVLKALSSLPRLQILDWLKNPVGNFPPQTDGHLIHDGVCAGFIRHRLGLAAATTSRHLGLLAGAGLIVPTRKKSWTFYRRNEAEILRFTQNFQLLL